MNMRIIFFILTGCILISGFSVFADKISISSGQSEYYYKVGTDARVPFTIESDFSDTLASTLQYSLTRHQDDEGFSISQTSTQSQSFPIAPGKTSHGLTLTSETDIEYSLSLLLLFQDKGQDYAVVLPPLTVHFVQDPKKFFPDKKTVRSSLSEATKTPSSSLIDPFSQLEQEMLQMRQEQHQLMQNVLSQSFSGTNRGTSTSSQNPYQSIQNYQIPASTSALQQQMIEESRQNEENKRKLADSLEKDPLVQQQSKDMKNAGYNQTSGRIVPYGPESGEVEIFFENIEGDKVSVTGKAVDSKISSLTAEKTGEVPVPHELGLNSTWNELKDKLSNSSMVPSSGTVNRIPNETTINQQYQGPDGRNALLTARMINGTVKEIILKEDDEFPLLWIIGILLITLLVVLFAGVGWWYYFTSKKISHAEEVNEFSVDLRQLVLEMLKQAKKKYESGEKKEGYAILGQATRMYISNTYGKGDAMTSNEIISGSRSFTFPEEKTIKEILRICSIIEYAKGEPEYDRFFGFLTKVREYVGADAFDE